MLGIVAGRDVGNDEKCAQMARARERASHRFDAADDARQGDERRSARVFDQVSEIFGGRVGVAHGEHGARLERRHDRPHERRHVRQDDEHPLFLAHAGCLQRGRQAHGAIGDVFVRPSPRSEAYGHARSLSFLQAIEEEVIGEVELFRER